MFYSDAIMRASEIHSFNQSTYCALGDENTSILIWSNLSGRPGRLRLLSVACYSVFFFTSISTPPHSTDRRGFKACSRSEGVKACSSFWRHAVSPQEQPSLSILIMSSSAEDPTGQMKLLITYIGQPRAAETICFSSLENLAKCYYVGLYFRVVYRCSF